jgi:hypothetical protein
MNPFKVILNSQNHVCTHLINRYTSKVLYSCWGFSGEESRCNSCLQAAYSLHTTDNKSQQNGWVCETIKPESYVQKTKQKTKTHRREGKKYLKKGFSGKWLLDEALRAKNQKAQKAVGDSIYTEWMAGAKVQSGKNFKYWGPEVRPRWIQNTGKGGEGAGEVGKTLIWETCGPVQGMPFSAQYEGKNREG